MLGHLKTANIAFTHFCRKHILLMTRVDRMSLCKSLPICSSTHYLSKLIHDYLVPWKKEAQKFALLLYFSKLPKVNSCTIGEYSNNLVTLLMTPFTVYKEFFCQCFNCIIFSSEVQKSALCRGECA
jgi:hypothetical protein